MNKNLSEKIVKSATYMLKVEDLQASLILCGVYFTAGLTSMFILFQSLSVGATPLFIVLGIIRTISSSILAYRYNVVVEKSCFNLRSALTMSVIVTLFGFFCSFLVILLIAGILNYCHLFTDWNFWLGGFGSSVSLTSILRLVLVCIILPLYGIVVSGWTILPCGLLAGLISYLLLKIKSKKFPKAQQSKY